MKLQRMRIEQLRQFRKPFVLDNLQPDYLPPKAL